MTSEVKELIRIVELVLGDFAKDRHGYGAAGHMLDWPTRASLQAALLRVKAEEETTP